MYRDTRLRATSEQLQHLGQLLDSGEAAPDAWKDYLTNGIEQLNVAMDEASRGDLQVKGLPADKEGPELTAFWKETWGDFGSALNAWPEIRRAAADIINPTQAA